MFHRRLGVHLFQTVALAIALLIALAGLPSASLAQLGGGAGLISLELGSGTGAQQTPYDASNPPADVTKLTAAAGDGQVVLEWVNPDDADFDGVLVLRVQGSPVTDVPTDGVAYTVGDSIGSSDVVCVTSSSASSCTDTGLTNELVYNYAAFSFDTSLNYADAVEVEGHPRATNEILWGFSTAGSALAPVGVIPLEHVIGIGNDQLLHRMKADDGTRGAWEPPLVGGAVQARPVVGNLNPGGSEDLTSYLSAQDGVLYRFALDDGTLTFEASADVVTDAGCTGGILQAGPVVLLDAFDSNANSDDDVVAVATRCGATDNKVMLYSHDLATLHDSYDGGVDGLGISNAAPITVYRNSANNLIFVPLRADGGESLIVLEVVTGPGFATTPYAQLEGFGDIDARPALVRRNVDRFIVIGNTIGEIYMFSAFDREGGAGSPLADIDAKTDVATDGPVKGIAVGTGKKVGSLYENWLVWTTDNTVHGMRIGLDGRFVDSSYWSTSISAPSAPLVLRYVGGTANTLAFVGSSDGYLYEIDATDGSVTRSFLVESGKTIGDPGFDYSDGLAQGIVVGSTSGTFHWVSLDWEGSD